MCCARSLWPRIALCVIFPTAISPPHIAWGGLETRLRLVSVVEETLKAYLSGNPVNVVSK